MKGEEIAKLKAQVGDAEKISKSLEAEKKSAADMHAALKAKEDQLKEANNKIEVLTHTVEGLKKVILYDSYYIILSYYHIIIS